MGLPKDFRWRQIRDLGSGGQATVIEVEDTTGALPGTYALKPLRKGASAKAFRRFSREVAAMKAVDHPGVIKIIESSNTEDQFHYYVMEYIPGATTLKKLLNSGNNPFYDSALRSLRLFEQLVGVIAAAKEAKVVHRDLSPANVLVLPDRSIKVIDFGICQIEGETTITLMDEGVGTINYMAPECESGAGGEVSFKSDLYSAGKILWSAITNQFAFSRESLVFNQKSLRALSRNIQTWHLHHIFERTIRHSPNDRFESPAEAFKYIKLVTDTIRFGFPPLEVLEKRCRVCYFGEVDSPPSWPGSADHPFRNPLPHGLVPVTCNYCGSWDLLDRNRLIAEIRRQTTLQ